MSQGPLPLLGRPLHPATNSSLRSPGGRPHLQEERSLTCAFLLVRVGHWIASLLQGMTVQFK